MGCWLWRFRGPIGIRQGGFAERGGRGRDSARPIFRRNDPCCAAQAREPKAQTMKRNRPRTTDEFVAAWKQSGGSPTVVMNLLGYTSTTAVSNRRAYIEKHHGIRLLSASPQSERSASILRSKSGRRFNVEIDSGIIVVGSDAHVWPGTLTTAQRGFIKQISDIQPDIVIMNGDVFDGARVSRFPAGIWDQEDRPAVQGEIEACQEFLARVKDAAPRAKRIWTWGNHDARFEMRLAAQNPEYKGVKGFALGDHFPEWQFCMAVFVNPDDKIPLVTKHRMGGGIGAKRLNTMKARTHTCTGHLHSLGAQEFTAYTGTSYGIDSGTLADPDGKQFDYTEEGPKDWRSGHRSSPTT